MARLAVSAPDGSSDPLPLRMTHWFRAIWPSDAAIRLARYLPVYKIELQTVIDALSDDAAGDDLHADFTAESRPAGARNGSAAAAALVSEPLATAMHAEPADALAHEVAVAAVISPVESAAADLDGQIGHAAAAPVPQPHTQPVAGYTPHWPQVSRRHGLRHGCAALQLVDQAGAALAAGDPQLGWRCFKAATRQELYVLAALDQPFLFLARTRAIYREGSRKLLSWRKAMIEDLLGHAGSPDDAPPVDRVAYAALILHEDQDNVYQRMAILESQLNWLSALAVAVVIAWIVTLPGLVGRLGTIAGPLDTPEFATAVVVFGLMGAITSSLLSSTSGLTGISLPDQLSASWLVRARLAMGAISALVVATFLVAGVLNLGPSSMALVLAAAFASGFSERLVLGLVDRLLQPATNDQPSPH